MPISLSVPGGPVARSVSHARARRLPDDTAMITRDMVRRAKPDPDLFLAAAAQLGIDPRDAMVVGDSVWDLLAARRAGAIGIGLM